MIRAGIRRIFRLGPTDAARLDTMIDEEIRLHLELRVEQLVRAGLTPETARAEAERRFGPLEEARRELRRTADNGRRSMRLRDSLDAVLLDVRHTVRGLRLDPGFTAVVVLTLALGIGANAAMFGVVDRLLLSGPAHVVDAGQVMRFYMRYPDSPLPRRQGTLSYAQYDVLREGTHAFDELAVYSGAVEATLERAGAKDRVRVRHASATLFAMLGVRPALGRFFTADEDVGHPGAPVVVLDHGAWRRLFGASRSILGQQVVIDGQSLTVIGVAPAGYTGSELEPVDFWIPVSSDVPPVSPDWRTTRAIQWLRVIGRLREGVPVELATAEATAAERRAVESLPELEEWMRTVEMLPLPLWFDEAGEEGMEVTVSRWLFGVSGIVLLIACANVANLLLARSVRRRREVAVRIALGVGRARLIRLLMLEGIALAVAGGAAGLAVAWWGGQLLRATLLEDVAWGTSPVSVRVFLFAVAATFVTGVLISVMPALRAGATSLVEALKHGTRQSGAGRSRLRAGLTIAQAALSAVLLVGAGLLVLSLWNVRQLRLGFDPERVLLVNLSWPRLGELPEPARDAERARREEFRAQLLDRLREIPGVASAATSVGTPFYVRLGTRFRVDGLDSLPRQPGGGPFQNIVSPDYFATVGTRILRGRPIDERDVEGSELVAVVNETVARTLWPAGDAIGRCVYIGDSAAPCRRIVGVAEDVHRLQIREERAMQVYFPIAQRPHGATALPIVRANGDPLALIPTLRQQLTTLDPSLRWVQIIPLQDRVSPQLRPWRLGATVFTLFGALALIVAAVGLYSVMAYVTAQRTHEIGVRLALGARSADVRRLILRSGLVLAAIGTTIGLAAALAGARWAEPMLFGTSGRNPAVIAAVAVVLLAVSIAACLVPARRAARVEPVVALRSE